MASNFLGEVSEVGAGVGRSMIISSAEMMAREGVQFTKSMNFRDSGPLPSVFLVIRREGEFKDVWDADNWVFKYEGKDSTTVEEGKSVDQILMYSSGSLSDNGKFFKAAQAFKDGVRKAPLPIQVYEKIAAGAWYDKGLFDLIDAEGVKEGGRTVYKFHLSPAGSIGFSEDSPEHRERMLPTEVKETAWEKGKGRCAQCGSQLDLYFVSKDGKDTSVQLLCGAHTGHQRRSLL